MEQTEERTFSHVGLNESYYRNYLWQLIRILLGRFREKPVINRLGMIIWDYLQCKIFNMICAKFFNALNSRVEPGLGDYLSLNEAIIHESVLTESVEVAIKYGAKLLHVEAWFPDNPNLNLVEQN